MCITFDEIPKLHKAVKNHTVYKVLINHPEYGLRSPYFYYVGRQWKLGRENKVKVGTYETVSIANFFNKIITQYITTTGLYCFRSINKAKKLIKSRKEQPFTEYDVIVTCIIPKGSYYYEKNGEICASSLKPIKIL